jgi:hypothetical protein
VRAAFEDEHPRNMVDASDAYALSVFPFGRDDERPEDYESEDWETGMMVVSGFKVNGSRSLGSPRADWLPALRRVTDGRIMVVREDEATWQRSIEWVIPA